MTNGSREEALELEHRLKKGRREKDSSRSTRRGFSRAQRAFAGRLSRPGYVAACSSRKPEALVKVVRDAPRGQNVRTLLHYISRTQGQADELTAQDGREQSVYLVDSLGEEYRSRAEVAALASEWIELFEEEKDRQTPESARKKRDVQHLVLSAKSDASPLNVQRVLEAAKTTVAAMFAEYDYVLGVHQDGKYPHAHLVVRCDAKTKGKGKLRINKPELLLLRTVWARELSAQGLEHVATLRQDRPHVVAAVAQGTDKLRGKRLSWFQATLADKKAGVPFLAKRQADLEAALQRLGGADEARRIRQEIGERINDLRQSIKANSRQDDPKRRAAFGALLKIERELKKHSDPLLRFRELAEQPGAHAPAYQYIAKSLETGKRLPQVSNTTTQEEIQKAYELHNRSIMDAKKELRRLGGMTKEQFMVAMQVLDIQDRAVRKALGLPDKPASRPRSNRGMEQQPAQAPVQANVKKPRDSGREL